MSSCASTAPSTREREALAREWASRKSGFFVNIATWNVNGIRARQAQALEWLARERPDIVCLQELKATPEQIPAAIWEAEGYWGYWHGGKAYSGVALLVRKAFCAERPVFEHPDFDFEQRIVTATVGGTTVASVYVPNGGKDFEAKMRFLAALESYAASAETAGGKLVICGDLNVARADIDVHPKERKPKAIGQLPEERAALARILAHGLVDVARALEPDNDQLFTWWAPWRNLRQRNIGWRIDYVLASAALAARASTSVSQRDVGTSDHAPVIAVFGE
jgi:exodeoxyribonuclease-3